MSSRQPPVVPLVQTTINCDGCDSEFDIQWFCKNCSASLCDECKARHESDRFLGKHKIVPRTGNVIREYDSSKIAEPCPDHPGKDISGYCNDCGAPCCMSCVAERHRRHDITAIEMKYMECEDEVNNTAIDLEKHVLEQLQTRIEELRETLKSSERKFITVKTEINNFRQELKNTVDKSCDTLIEELETKAADQKSDISEVVKYLENNIRENESFISLCGDKIREGGLDLIQFSKVPPPPKGISEPNFTNSTAVFSPGTSLVNMISQNIGKIEWERGCYVATNAKTDLSPNRSDEGTPSVLMVRKDEDKTTNVTSTATSSSEKTNIMMHITDVRTMPMFYQIQGSSLIPTGKGTTWISDLFSNTMYMLDDNCAIVRSVSVPEGIEILDIAVKRSGDVIVSNSDKKVRMVTVNSVVTTLFDTEPFLPQGVCLTEKEEIMVCMSGQDDRNHVVIYSADGKSKVKVIEIKGEKRQQMLPNPFRVVVNGSDITILNLKSHVVTADQNGKVKWVFDGSKIKKKEFHFYGMCVEKLGHPLISDMTNNCVYYVDSEGVLLKQLLTQDQHGIKWSWGIGVDGEKGTIWLGSVWMGSFWIVKYQQR